MAGSVGEVDMHEQDHWAWHDLAGETLECSESGEGGILGSRDCSWPLSGTGRMHKDSLNSHLYC